MKVTVCEDIELQCQVCSHDEFEETPRHTGTTGGSLFELARGFVCSRCGYVHWFVPVEGQSE